MSKHTCLSLLEQALDSSYFEPGLLRGQLQAGAKSQRFFVVTGPNASGKSFVGKLFGGLVRQLKLPDMEVMNVGMSFRTQQGVARAFIFGDEAEHSTGLNSFKALRGGLTTCRGRETPHVLLLDEPDIGLSESFQGAVGQMCADFARELPEQTWAFGIVTHSRRLLRHLLPLRPHHIRCGGDQLTLQQVVDQEPQDLTPEQVEQAQDSGLQLWRGIDKVVNRRRAVE